MNIREFLQSEVNKSRRVYNLRRRQFKKAERELSEIMDAEISASLVYLASSADLHLNFRIRDISAGRKLATVLMDAVGVNHAQKRNIVEGTYTIIIERDGLRLDIDVDARPCKKLLVTEQRVIEVCGEVDTSRYLSVVPLED